MLEQKQSASTPDLVLGYYKNPIDGSLIVTQLVGNNYETLVKSPNFNGGEARSIENYRMNKDRAKSSHVQYVLAYGRATETEAKDSLGPKPYQTKSNNVDDLPLPVEVKISFIALIKIFHELTNKTIPLIIEKSGIKDCLKLTIKEGLYQGTCSYDMIDCDAYDIQGSWKNIFQDTKSSVINRIRKSKIKE